MTDTYGFGIVGCGFIAPTHAAAIAELPRAELRAVTDPDRDRRESVAERFGVDAHADTAELLARDDIDVVCVCVPSGLHAAVGVDVARAGKHLVVEKPLEVNLEAADRLLDAIAAAGVKLAVISQHRFFAGTRRLRDALESGRLGKVILGNASIKRYRTQAYYDSGDWRGSLDLDGGGALMNQGVHYVDLLQWMMGPVESVYARATTRAHEIDVEDVLVADVGFANGALGVIEASTAVYPGLPDRLEITGEGGTVIVEEGEVTLWRLKDEAGHVDDYGGAFERPPFRFDPRVVPVESHREQIGDLLDGLDEGREPMVNGIEARKPLEIILAIYESARTRAEVSLSR